MKSEASRLLRVLYRAVDGTRNETAVCEYLAEAGRKCVRFCTDDAKVQRIYLNSIGRRFPVFYEGRTLEGHLPFYEGHPFLVYDKEEAPNFLQRKRICLELLAEVIEEHIPSALLVYMLSPEKIVLTGRGARLQYYLDFSEEIPSSEVYNRLAMLCFEVLNPSVGLTEKDVHRYPLEYQLLWRRVHFREYGSFEQLCRDLNALPDECLLREQAQSPVRMEIRKKLLPWAMKSAVALLAVLAAYCTVGALLEGTSDKPDPPFKGIEQIGDQVLSGQ